MEKIVYLRGDDLKKVNELLEQGWKVKSINAVSGPEHHMPIYAYAVLYKQQNNDFE